MDVKRESRRNLIVGELPKETVDALRSSEMASKRRQFIRNERKYSMAISARRQLGLGPNE